MALEYNTDSHWEDIVPVLTEYTEWFHDVLRCIFYSEDAQACYGIQKPGALAQWLQKASLSDDIQGGLVDKLTSLNQDLFQIADKVMAEARTTKQKPSAQLFMEFMTIFEELQNTLQRLEKDFLIEGSGFDSKTGLRSGRLLEKDLQREFERLARQGKPFTVAMIRVDDFSILQKAHSAPEVTEYIKLLASLIKLSIRSFDDAYYTGDGKYVLSLKQTDITGGIAALERLRRELENKRISFNVGNRKDVLTLSCCITEPGLNDNIENIIENLSHDLNNNMSQRKDSILRYQEMSPLQKYVKGTHH